MITERTGDIFEQPDLGGIVQNCNTEHCLGAGLARIIAQRFPEAEEADNATPKGEEKLGTFSFAQVTHYGRPFVIFNLYGQSGVGNDGDPLNRNARYDALFDAFYRLHEKLEQNNLKGKKLGVPYGLGCDLAGGKFRIVRAILESVFGDSELEVVIVRLPNCRDLD